LKTRRAESAIADQQSSMNQHSAFKNQHFFSISNQQSKISISLRRRLASIGTASGAVFEIRLPCEPARLHEPVEQDRHALGL
jgi:hypothetical protein